jgi:hypothetical protein
MDVFVNTRVDALLGAVCTQQNSVILAKMSITITG